MGFLLFQLKITNVQMPLLFQGLSQNSTTYTSSTYAVRRRCPGGCLFFLSNFQFESFSVIEKLYGYLFVIFNIFSLFEHCLLDQPILMNEMN